MTDTNNDRRCQVCGFFESVDHQHHSVIAGAHKFVPPLDDRDPVTDLWDKIKARALDYPEISYHLKAMEKVDMPREEMLMRLVIYLHDQTIRDFQMRLEAAKNAKSL